MLLLDEPFAAVDSIVRRHQQDTLEEVRGTLDVPVVLVTHDLDDVIRLATHLLVLESGRVVDRGRVADVVPRFLGS